jgi:IMP cyclohydrolase
MDTIESILGENRYPGSGILAGSLGGRSVIAYFITARGAYGRNRFFREEGESLAIRSYGADKARERQASLFFPVRVCGGSIVVSNGDHTDTICASLAAGHTFQYAMSARCFEYDAPVYTPRIAALMLPTGRYTIGIVKKADDSADCRRKYWSCDAGEGVAHLIFTYDGDGEPPPSYSGEPFKIEISGSPAELADRIWRALGEKNRVALYTRFTNLSNGKYDSAIKNAGLGD